MGFKGILHNLPEVKSPIEKRLSFNVKLKWTLIILVAYFVLSNLPLFGITKGSLDKFEYLAILLGTSFGSIITLGIGPIVMASIILQLLVGVQIIKIDYSKPEGKKFFSAVQKLLTFVFIIFEAMIYVLMGGIRANPGFTTLVIFQLCLGGLLIVFMDEVIQKWGFGSGVSLFIAAGIGWRLFSMMFQFIGTQGTFEASGYVLAIIASVIVGDGTGVLRAAFPIVITSLLFLVVVFAQSLKVEIPLSYDRIRGYSIKWPLQFFYSGVIPVILVSALAANIQFFAIILQNWLGKPTFLGAFNEGIPYAGFAFWISEPRHLIDVIITNSLSLTYVLNAVIHILFYVVLSTLFAYFWISTSGQDAKSQAKRIIDSGMSIPGFRKDERVLESILNRYVVPLTIMGGAAIGFLASFANLLGAMVGGTAILLAVMILYQLYQNIAQQHAIDMNPALRGFFKA